MDGFCRDQGDRIEKDREKYREKMGQRPKKKYVGFTEGRGPMTTL